MNADLRDAILKTLNAPHYTPLKPAILAKHLRLKGPERKEFHQTVAALLEAGTLKEDKRGRLLTHRAIGAVVGVVRKISSGSAYLLPHPDANAPFKNEIFIRQEDLRDAHTGDEVLVRLAKRKEGETKRLGRVEEVLKRATQTFVGTYDEQDGVGVVRVDGAVFDGPILVGDPGAKGAAPGDKVVIEMLRFPTATRRGEAVLTKLLGPVGAPEVDTLGIIHEFGLPLEFPEAALEQASHAATAYDETVPDGRLDLTNELIVTIDPIDARDFDDAISLSRSDDGHWHLGVHIADVSHFVPLGSPLDDEAQQRGTSVYLPGRVIPMLPEVLSNGLASLQEARVRFTKSAFIEFSAEGIAVHSRFANSAIRVTKRLHYEQVMPIVRGDDDAAAVSENVRALLIEMHRLAMLLRGRRFAAGALELDLAETKLQVDRTGAVTGVRQVEHDESHQMIEEFMLAANIAVATELNDRHWPFIRRVHPEPDYFKLELFAGFVQSLGYDLKQPQSRPALQELIRTVRGQPTEHAVNYAMLRSLKQASYSVADEGHYALAEENYCHFTSPIRRYPDLVVHRLIDLLIAGKKKGKGTDEITLEAIAVRCSDLSRRAEAAERELVKIKLLRYLQDRVGEELDAVITGVERFGVFCRGVELPAEGLIHISAIGAVSQEMFDFDQSAHALIGRNTGWTLQLGSPLRVKIFAVDPEARKLDFVPVADQIPAVHASRIGKKSASASPNRQPVKKKPSRPPQSRQPGRRRRGR